MFCCFLLILLSFFQFKTCMAAVIVRDYGLNKEISFQPYVNYEPNRIFKSKDNFILFPLNQTTHSGVNIYFNLQDAKTASFHHFWRSSGLCPPPPLSSVDEFLLSFDEKMNLILVGSLPFQGISQVRVHWLLNLVKAESSDNVVTYNFTSLDRFLDILYQWKLKPGFEVMGNPSGIFTDFTNKTQIFWWRDLVEEMAKRYIDKYGLNWVKTWNWESWNEPDHHDFDNLNFTLQGFLNYFDASREGLKLASKHLVFGGPGGSCRDPKISKLCWKILDHCNNGSNYFHPDRPTDIHFISFHKKGNEDISSMIEAELDTIRKIRTEYKNLQDVPIYNDEGDFLKGWWKPRDWKGDVRYAAFVATSVIKHTEMIQEFPTSKFTLLSFDNSFLNDLPNYFFRQRTLIARFHSQENTQNITQIIKKPAYYIMSFLALLGNRIKILPSKYQNDERISILVTYRRQYDELNNSNVFGNKNNENFEYYDKMRILNNGTQSQIPINTNNINNNIYNKKNNNNNNNRNDDTYMEEVETRKSNLGSEQERTKTATNRNSANKLKLHKRRERGKMIKANTRRERGKRIKANTKRERLKRIKATNTAEEISILISFSNTTVKSWQKLSCDLELIMPMSFLEVPVYVAEYSLDETIKEGVFTAWMDLNSPKNPSRSQLRTIRKYEGASNATLRKLVLKKRTFSYKAELGLPSVRLIHFCSFNQVLRPEVTRIQLTKISNKDLLITWSDEKITTRCIWKYEVYYCKDWSEHKHVKSSFTVIKRKVQLENNFLYSLWKSQETLEGWYTVRAVLYDGTKGPIPKPVFFKND